MTAGPQLPGNAPKLPVAPTLSKPPTLAAPPTLAPKLPPAIPRVAGLTIVALLTEAKRRAQHPYFTAYSMCDHAPWGLGYLLWNAARWETTRARIGAPVGTRCTSDAHHAAHLQTLVEYVNNYA